MSQPLPHFCHPSLRSVGKTPGFGVQQWVGEGMSKPFFEIGRSLHMNGFRKYDYQVAIIIGLVFVVWMTAWLLGR